METENKTNSNTPTQAFILSTCGDFTLEPLGAIKIKEDIEFDDCDYDSLWGIVLIPRITVPAAIKIFLDDYLEESRIDDFIGDEDYYDYIPDAIDQILMLASQESKEAYEFAKNKISTDEFLLRKNEPEEPMLIIEDYEYYLDRVNKVKEIL